MIRMLCEYNGRRYVEAVPKNQYREYASIPGMKILATEFI